MNSRLLLNLGGTVTRDEERRMVLALENIAKGFEDQNRLSAKYYNDQREYMQLQTSWTNFLKQVNGVE